MRLKQIAAINFKNIFDAKIELSDKVNCFVGINGSGKTNLLDAIFYTSMCKSLTGSTDGQTTRFGEEFFMIDAEYVNNNSGSHENIVCSFKKGGDKIIKRNGKRYDRLSDHIGVIPIIVISPYDTALINDAAQERRKFLNVLISQIDKDYLQSLIKYNSLLAQRNKLLKVGEVGFSSDYLEIVDMQLCEEAVKIWRKRGEFIEMLAPQVVANYEKISGGREEIALQYRSELDEGDFAALLIKNFERDRALGYTYSGIHRDDMVIKINSHPLKRFGSWGQQKSLLVALKLSEFDMIFQRRGVKPILLLDNYDSFTYNLLHEDKELGYKEVDVFRNDKISLDEIDKYDKIILSPGPGIPVEAGILLDVIKMYAPTKSILGVCLGHQAIGEVFGGTLENLTDVYHGVQTPIDITKEDVLFNDMEREIEVGRYHSWVVSPENFPSSELEITAVSKEGQIMALRHKEYKVWGIQFHPESVLTPQGRTIISNFLKG